MKVSLSTALSGAWYDALINLKIPDDQIFTRKSIQIYSNLATQFLNITSLHQQELKKNGYLEFSNLPIDIHLCPPPQLASRPYPKGYISESVLLGITHACGIKPFSYLQEKKGALVHEITPIAQQKESISSEGTLEFAFHTDGAYLSRDLRPHTLALMCLEDEQGTSTNLVQLHKILQYLDLQTKEILASARYIHTAPETFKVRQKQIQSSILDKVDGQYEIKVALHTIQALDKEAEDALNCLKAVIHQNINAKVWKKGNLILFNNLKCLHGRGEIQGLRWLQRCYGSYTFPSSTIINLNEEVLNDC